MYRLFTVLLLLISSSSFSHTWDEPWHIEVVEESTSFALFKIIKNNGDYLDVELIKHLAGEKPKDKIRVNDFYKYDVVSTNSKSDEHDFWVSEGVQAYLFLKNENGEYKIATPTTGYAEVIEEKFVAATYRHSLNQAKLSINDYEESQICIFNVLHGDTCNADSIKNIILSPLQKAVAVLSPEASKEDFETFFKQHMALETAFIIKQPIDWVTLKPFVESKFFHSEVSAIRALSISDIEDKEMKLANFITESEGSNLAKVMAVIMLGRTQESSFNVSVADFVHAASEEEVSLGGGFMDPRVGTWFPRSLKDAINWYINENTKNSSETNTSKDIEP